VDKHRYLLEFQPCQHTDGREEKDGREDVFHGDAMRQAAKGFLVALIWRWRILQRGMGAGGAGGESFGGRRSSA
jgi:hypothetical protein